MLRSRNCALEIENEKLQAENKQLMMTKAVKNTTTTKLHSSEVASLKTKITTLEKQLETSRKVSSLLYRECILQNADPCDSELTGKDKLGYFN